MSQDMRAWKWKENKNKIILSFLYVLRKGLTSLGFPGYVFFGIDASGVVFLNSSGVVEIPLFSAFVWKSYLG